MASVLFAAVGLFNGRARAEVTSAMDYPSNYGGSSGSNSSSSQGSTSYSSASSLALNNANRASGASTGSSLYPSTVYERISGTGYANAGGVDITTYVTTDLLVTVKYVNGWPVSITYSNTSRTDTYWISGWGGANTFNTATATSGYEIKPGQVKTVDLVYYHSNTSGAYMNVPFDYQYYQKKTSTGSLGITGTNNSTLTNFSATPSTTNGTRFTNVTQRGGTVRSTFTLRNRSTGTLILRGTPTVKLIGSDSSQFRIAVQPVATLNAGGSTSYVVEYAPNASGTHWATVCFNTNDSSNRTVMFAVSGTASLPAPVQLNYFNWFYMGSSLRIWQRSGTVWTERSLTGSVETFDSTSTGTLGSSTFILVRSRTDSKKELLIPNLDSVFAGLWCRYNGGTWSKLATTLLNCR